MNNNKNNDVNLLTEGIKVHFKLEPEGDGFPPIGVESLNGYCDRSDLVRLDNTPFFAIGVALGDVVLYEKHPSKNEYWYCGVYSESGNKALSIIFLDEACKEEVYQHLKSSGCYCEYGEFGNFNMLAVGVYASLNYSEIASYLGEKEAGGLISYAELCV